MKENWRSPDSPRAGVSALVLGGGGPVGASWMSALLHQLGSAGLPLVESDMVLGTSAGAVVGAWLTMQPDGLLSVPERMRRRAAWHAANAESGRGDKDLLRRVVTRSGPGTESTLTIAKAAAAAIPPISAEQAEALWTATLPERPWSPRLRVVSVNGATGFARAWSARDRIPLAVAVACATAGPGAAPPVAVADSFWVDGGIRSGTNADLISESGSDNSHGPQTIGPGNVLVLAPLPSDNLLREQAILVARGHRVRVITAEPFYQSITDLLDPKFVDIAAAAGFSQARDIATDLVAWWHI